MYRERGFRTGSAKLYSDPKHRLYAGVGRVDKMGTSPGLDRFQTQPTWEMSAKENGAAIQNSTRLPSWLARELPFLSSSGLASNAARPQQQQRRSTIPSARDRSEETDVVQSARLVAGVHPLNEEGEFACQGASLLCWLASTTIRRMLGS